MLKAYLAHSAKDKDYVSRVANLLGRPSVLYDNMYFEPGVDLLKSITKGLDKSRLFVFFASRNSLRSYFVDFEIEEARWKILRGEMGGAITISIDRDLDIKRIPLWMRTTLIATIPSPIQAVRTIRQALIEHDSMIQLPFVGREQDLSEFSRKLIGRPGERRNRIIAVSGLDGVGRKTFVTRATKDYLGLAAIPILKLEETSSLDSLHMQLLDETSEKDSRKDLALAVKSFAEMPAPEQGREIARLLTLLAQYNQVPMIVDENAMLDDHSRYHSRFLHVFQALAEYPDTHVAFIHNRRPDLSSIPGTAPGVAYYRLDPLRLEDTELLVQQSLHMAGVNTDAQQVKTVALYMGGYPPAVEIVSRLAKFYGLDPIIADKPTLTDIQVRRFSPVLRKLNLTDNQWSILRVLADFASLPFELIVDLIAIEPEECSHELRKLIDWSLVLPIGGDFTIAPPIKMAVLTIRGSFTSDEYTSFANRLVKAFWQDPAKAPRLSVIDATIHALARSGDKKLDGFRDIIVPSQLHKVAKEEYDSRNWDAAIDFAQRTLVLDPGRDAVLIILCKALVRKEQWREAEDQIIKLQKKGHRAQFYCRGFLEWKRGDLGAAVTAFKSALDAGDRSISVYRDLSHCLFRLGQTAQAKDILSGLPEWAFRNQYVVDLAAQIAIAEKEWIEAERYVSDMEQLATSEEFLYRRATLKAARGQRGEALVDIEVACRGERRRFEALAQKADILIELGRFPEADSTIGGLVPTGLLKKDVKIGLICKMLLHQGKWREADVRWHELYQKDLPVSQALRKDILTQKLMDKMTSPIERMECEQELTKIGGLIQLPLVVSEDDE